MARLNIEDAWWTDARRTYLVRLLRDDRIADGLMLQTWRLAQAYWGRDESPIPQQVWKLVTDGALLIEAGLAEQWETGVYIKGTREHFQWLAERKAAGQKGGLASAIARAKKSGDGVNVPVNETNLCSSKAQAKVNQSSSKAQANASKPKQTQPSYSYSYSNTEELIHRAENDVYTAPDVYSGQAQSETIKPDPMPPVSAPPVATQDAAVAASPGTQVDQKQDKARKHTPEQAAKIKRFVEAYVTGYQSRFPDQRPEDLSDGKTRGQIALYAKDHPDIDRACQLIQVFFQLDRKWFQTRGWDFITFKSNLNVIAQALDSGEDPDGGIDWAKFKKRMEGQLT